MKGFRYAMDRNLRNRMKTGVDERSEKRWVENGRSLVHNGFVLAEGGTVAIYGIPGSGL